MRLLSVFVFLAFTINVVAQDGITIDISAPDSSFKSATIIVADIDTIKSITHPRVVADDNFKIWKSNLIITNSADNDSLILEVTADSTKLTSDNPISIGTLAGNHVIATNGAHTIRGNNVTFTYSGGISATLVPGSTGFSVFDIPLRVNADSLIITDNSPSNDTLYLYDDGTNARIGADNPIIIEDHIIGTDIQAFGDILDDLNTLGAASADGEFIVATGAGAFAYESGATARASLGIVDSVVNETVTVTAEDREIIIGDATGGSFTVNLPAVASSANFTITIKKVDATANTITVDGNASETIDDATTFVITSQYESITIACDGSSWWIY